MAMVGRISTSDTVNNSFVLRFCTSIPTVVLLDGVLEQPRSKMSPRIHSNNLLLISPLRKGTKVCGRFGVGEIGSVYDTVSYILFY